MQRKTKLQNIVKVFMPDNLRNINLAKPKFDLEIKKSIIRVHSCYAIAETFALLKNISACNYNFKFDKDNVLKNGFIISPDELTDYGWVHILHVNKADLVEINNFEYYLTKSIISVDIQMVFKEKATKVIKFYKQ